FEGFHFKVQEGRTVFNLGETTPIGNNAFPFYGSFDGNFANFNVFIIGEAYTGLFGYFGKGTIKNLYVTGSITGTTYVGGVVGYKVSGLIQNVYNAATISGTTQVGGIVGRNKLGNIETPFNNAKVFASTSYAGGILGYLYEGTVQNVYNHGEILSPLYAGGIAGGSMLTQRSTYDVYHYNAILNS